MESIPLLLGRTSVKISQAQSPCPCGSSPPPYLSVISSFVCLSGGGQREGVPRGLSFQQVGQHRETLKTETSLCLRKISKCPPSPPHPITKAVQLYWGSADQTYPEISIPSILQLSEQSMELSSALQNLFALLILTLLSQLHGTGEHIPRKQFPDNFGACKSAGCCSSFLNKEVSVGASNESYFLPFYS